MENYTVNVPIMDSNQPNDERVYIEEAINQPSYSTSDQSYMIPEMYQQPYIQEQPELKLDLLPNNDELDAGSEIVPDEEIEYNKSIQFDRPGEDVWKFDNDQDLSIKTDNLFLFVIDDLTVTPVIFKYTDGDLRINFKSENKAEKVVAFIAIRDVKSNPDEANTYSFYNYTIYYENDKNVNAIVKDYRDDWAIDIAIDSDEKIIYNGTFYKLYKL